METVKKVQAVEHHPRSPDASLEQLRALARIVTIPGPLPSTKFLDDEAEAGAIPTLPHDFLTETRVDYESDKR